MSERTVAESVAECFDDEYLEGLVEKQEPTRAKLWVQCEIEFNGGDRHLDLEFPFSICMDTIYPKEGESAYEFIRRAARCALAHDDGDGV